MRRPIPAASVRPASLVLRRQTRPAAPMGRSLVPTAAAGPDYAVKTTPILTLVRVGTAVQTPGEVRLRPRLRPVPAVLLREPVTKLRRTLTATAVPAGTAAQTPGEVRLRPRPRPVPAVLLREPVTKLRRTPTVTAVPAGTLLQLVHLITSKAGQQLKYALAAQLREPAISVKIPVTATAVRLMPVARLRAENRNVLAVPVMCPNLQAVYVSAGLTPNISNAAVVPLF